MLTSIVSGSAMGDNKPRITSGCTPTNGTVLQKN